MFNEAKSYILTTKATPENAITTANNIARSNFSFKKNTAKNVTNTGYV